MFEALGAVLTIVGEAVDGDVLPLLQDVASLVASVLSVVLSLVGAVLGDLLAIVLPLIGAVVPFILNLNVATLLSILGL